jgi:hypothetical protein
MKAKVRGSSKLGPMSVEDLQKSIGAAQALYKVKRWIIKGIPPIYDRVDAVLDVNDVSKAGEVIQGLIRLQNSRSEVGVVVFPYGIPFVDGVLLNVGISFSTGPGPVSTGPGPAE